MNQNIKNEFPFFIKSTLLVLLISSIVSAFVLTLQDNQGTTITLATIGSLLGYNLYGISAFSIFVTALFLQPQEDHKNFRQLTTNLIKISLYYGIILFLIFLLKLVLF